MTLHTRHALFWVRRWEAQARKWQEAGEGAEVPAGLRRQAQRRVARAGLHAATWREIARQ